MKILIIELSNIGDVLLTYPALGALRQAYPGAQFHVMVTSRTQDLFRQDPRFQKVWLLDKQDSLWTKMGIILRLMAQQFNVVVDFKNSLLPLLFVGARRTPLRRRPVNRIHRMDQHSAVCTSIGVPLARTPMLPFFSTKDNDFIIQKIEMGKRLVVISPGSRSHLKRWPAVRFADVADRLCRDQPTQIILVGDTAERPVSHEVMNAMVSPAFNLTGATTFGQLLALIKRADLVITNDNACLHAAQIFGTPTVALFGPTDEKKYGPRNLNSRVVRRPMICAPCERAQCPYSHECLQQMEVESVYKAVSEVLVRHG